MKKVLAIINPISGTGSKKNIPDLLGQAYNASEYELFLTYTKAAGHAEELARRAASEGYDHVIAVDGGTQLEGLTVDMYGACCGALDAERLDALGLVVLVASELAEHEVA